jgi:hypothetical protein
MLSIFHETAYRFLDSVYGLLEISLKIQSRSHIKMVRARDIAHCSRC